MLRHNNSNSNLNTQTETAPNSEVSNSIDNQTDRTLNTERESSPNGREISPMSISERTDNSLRVIFPQSFFSNRFAGPINEYRTVCRHDLEEGMGELHLIRFRPGNNVPTPHCVSNYSFVLDQLECFINVITDQEKLDTFPIYFHLMFELQRVIHEMNGEGENDSLSMASNPSSRQEDIDESINNSEIDEDFEHERSPSSLEL